MFNSAESRDRYKKLEGEVRNKIKNAKRGMEKKLAYSQNGNSRQFANYIKSKTKAKISIGPLKDKNGKMISEEKEIANELNAFFSSVFTEEVLSNMPVKEVESNSSLSDIHITKKKIIEKIKNLKQNSAPGPDEIGTKLLKTASQEIAKPLCYIFNESLRTGLVPADWRKATVTPIFKKGPKGDPGNYRPVSLTSIPCRMMESIIKDNLMPYLTENKLLRESQPSFLTGRSCTTNLIEFTDKITRIL